MGQMKIGAGGAYPEYINDEYNEYRRQITDAIQNPS